MRPAKRVRVEGVVIAYQEAGAGRALLCVHGNFAGKRWFAEQLRRPPAGWRVIAPDLPNFGESDPMPEAISLEAYAVYLRGFIRALALEPFVLLGHSLGGAVAMTYAAGYPNTLSGLVLVSSSAPSGLKTPEERYRILEMLRGNREGMAWALAPTMPTRRPEYFGEIVKDALGMAPAAYTGNARALEGRDLTPALRAVTCPVLVVHGGLDRLVSESMARATAAAFPKAKLTLLENVGHSPQIEDPAGFDRLLEDFLEGLP